MNVLVFNTGSASLKFDLVACEPGATKASQGKKLVSGILEGIGKEGVLSLLQGKDTVHQEPVDAADYGEAARRVFTWLGTGASSGSLPSGEIGLVAHRVVHGADRFSAAALIDDDVIAGIESLEDLAPLHNAPAIAVIRAARDVLGPDKPMVAGFDTVFHRDIPAVSHTYAIPAELAKKHRIRRYGFHGLSHGYLLERYSEITGTARDDANIVTMHLESGCSVCAIRSGKSVETSMGFTPLEGLVMGMRSGDLDPALVGFLARKEQLSIEQVEELLNKRSGLLGLSGVSHDTRELMKQLENNPQVELAMQVFCHRIVKYVGAYLAVLGGASAIVFGGGIGEDEPWVRTRVCAAFEWCGLTIDESANRATINREGRISSTESRLHAYVLPTEEGLALAAQAVQCFLSASR